jgi:hypothetical protein
MILLEGRAVRIKRRRVPLLNHNVASAWNAGFIRQTDEWHMSLPDKSGVPAAIKMHPNKKAAENFRGLMKTN